MSIYQSLRNEEFQGIPFPVRVSLNEDLRFSSLLVNGYNASVLTAEEDLTGAGGTTQLLASAETMDIVSTSALDTIAGGTGANILLVVGLDKDYNVVSEPVLLSGLVPVTTNLEFIRIRQLVVLQAGSTLSNAGTITATATTSATVQCTMLPTTNRNQDLFYTVPSGKAAIPVANGVGGTGALAFRTKVRFPTSNVFVTTATIANSFVSTSAMLDYLPGLAERTDFKITAQGFSGSSAASASVTFLEVDSRYFRDIAVF